MNAHDLLQNSIGGSGYDVACAESDSAILYSLAEGNSYSLILNWKPAFADKIYFAHLGKKQSSPDAIKYYKQQLQNKTQAANEISRLTNLLWKATELSAFEEIIKEHETLVGSQLKMLKVKDSLFNDYWGSVKSLGAWGGDFVMLTNTESREDLNNYMAQKNIDTILSWEEMIL